MIEFIVSTKKEPEPEMYYEMGDIFYHSGGTPYILADTGGGVCLVNLKDGNRWSDPKYVCSSSKITKEEFQRACGSHPREFKKVKSAKLEVEL